MIASHSFTEALEQNRLRVIPFRLLQVQAAVLIGILENPRSEASDSLKIRNDEIDWLSAQPESEEDYDGLMGGDFHICQSQEDLLTIEGFDLAWSKTHYGRLPNVTDRPMSWDICTYLSEEDGKPHWVQFLLCSSDAGGHVYFVPKELWETARVEEHITATQKFWK